MGVQGTRAGGGSGQVREGCSAAAATTSRIPLEVTLMGIPAPGGPTRWDKRERLRSAEGRGGNGVLASKGYLEGSAALPPGWLLCKLRSFPQVLKGWPRRTPWSWLAQSSVEWVSPRPGKHPCRFLRPPSAFRAPSSESAHVVRNPPGARSSSGTVDGRGLKGPDPAGFGG